ADDMPEPRECSRVVRTLDLIIGIVLTLIAALVGITMLAFVGQLGQLATACAGVTPDGMRCEPGFLGAMGILGTAIVVLGWFLPAGFLIVRAIRRQLVFFLPIVAIVVMIAGYYLVVLLLGTAYVPSSST
ncbi:MAG: hypothetical protein M3Y46_11935, partial [Actinomycetota bacterium]|nr:hypothetical protein [Actinomycetota bacterium]